MSRSSNSIKNITYALIGQSIGLIVSFFSRLVFIRCLGTEYLGLNGLFTNILTVLSLAELGVGEAITFSLYKPLSTKNSEKCLMLMSFYKKVYIIIGIIILLVGVSITPFLNFFISDIPDIPNISIIYILFVINSAASYMFSYKRNLIIADQKRYIATIYRYSFYSALNILQIIVLLLTNNYILFLSLQILNTIIENLLISVKANRMYPFLNSNKKIPLDTESKTQIIKNTKAMMMHKIGGIVVSSTDNIIISKFINLVTVGLYSNYYLIINALNTIIGQFFSSILASVGHLFATESKEKCYSVFNRVYFLNYCIYSTSSICLLVLFNSFIELWLGKNYILTPQVVLILVINFYVTGMRKSAITFKEAAGLFYNDRWKSILEAIINLFFSIILVQYFGLLGVFIGTFISSVTVCVWIEPFVLYKNGFDKSLKEYFKKYFCYCFATIISAIVSVLLFSLIDKIGIDLLLAFLIKAILAILLSFMFIVLFFSRTSEFSYYLNNASTLIKKISGKQLSKRKH